jgi:membrane peptidoglycan carboxypeptidase
MPEELEVAPSAQTTYVYASDGKALITSFYEDRRPTKLAEMSPYITQAIVASEDTRFYQHNGASCARCGSPSSWRSASRRRPSSSAT